VDRREGVDRRKRKALIDMTSRLTRGASGAVSWAETALREEQMPRDEVRIVATSADRELVRR
jgi:hypothetical protein